jgi:hypothetical protein
MSASTTAEKEDPMKKIMRWTAISFAVLFIGLQFVRPAKTNPATDQARRLEQHAQMSDEVKATLKRACYDCHSNETIWPWYSQVAPVSWFVIDHVNHGRSHLNFSDWSQYDLQEQAKYLEGIEETVQGGQMPLPSYLLAHREAELSPDDKRLLGEWAREQQRRLLSGATGKLRPQ